MKKLLASMAISALFGMNGVALAQTPAATTAAKPAATTAAAPAAAMAAKPATTNSQQDKMKACNESATGKTGDERKKYMSSCLSNKPAKKESKISMCNKKTAGMSGDARSKAQSECMKAS